MPETPDPKKPLPPGVVLGPDGKPCKICTAFRYWKPHKQQQSDTAGSSSASTAAAAAATAAATAATAISNSSDSDTRSANCPPDVESLGRATWTFLHTTAAYYPDKPSPAHQSNMLALLRSLPVLYPCTQCATHLGATMKDHPPEVSSRLTLSRWLCERHNEVNEYLGKKKFDCGIKSLDERWKDGPPDGSCD